MTIKLKHLCLLLLTSIFTATAICQNKALAIENIRKEFKAINQDKKLTARTLENDDFLEQMTDGGGKLTGYYKGDKIKKIYCWVGLSNRIDIHEYYFKDEQLIFVYKKSSSFAYDNKKQELDYTKTETSFEGRYYLQDKKLIDTIITGQKPFEAEQTDPATALNLEADEYVQLLNKNK